MFRCLCRNFGSCLTPQQECKIPLKSVSFNSTVQNSLANLTITQSFLNEEQKPFECEYMFSVPDDSVITSLKIHLKDGTVLTAKLESVDKAEETYQDSISEGNTVVLGKVEEDEIMTLLIGNLAPNDSILVVFTLVFPLSSDESSWKFSIPSGFLPSSDLISLLSFDFSIQILSQSPIISYSSNCNLNFSLSPDSLILKGNLPPESLKSYLNIDFWVKFRSSDTSTPSCILQKIGSKCIAMLSFIPFNSDIESLDEVEGQGEYFFVLDRSGSMQGDRIEMAKQAAILFINSLPTGSLFNIVSFGSTHQFLFVKSEINTSNFVKFAIKKIKSFEADLGGTHIFEPLNQVFSETQIKGMPRTIFLLTDGQVSDSEEVIKMISMNSENCRVHGFGIGQDVDESLIKKSAKAGKGCASFITNTEDIGKKVISALKKCIFPCVSEWGIDWIGECYPNTNKLGSLYYGERCIQYIMLEEMPNQAINLRFFDNYTKDIKKYSLSNFQEVPGDGLLKLWTKGKLDYLLENFTENKNQIIELSLESGIPTKLTSFICIKENEEPIIQDMVTRKIPRFKGKKNNAGLSFLSKKSAHGACSLGRGRGRSYSKCLPSKLSSSSVSDPNILYLCSSEDLSLEKIPMKRDRNRSRERERDGRVENFKLDENIYTSLIQNLETEGYWKYEQFSLKMPDIKKVPKGFVKCLNEENVICTVFILAYLHKKFQDKFDEWVLIERKALRWLKANGVLFKDLQGLVDGYIS